ncbi:uncharacterized protein [Pyrus communis]|uniref:uncharacterized protein n=1 Tax=Pyrus communis TaxID=23211 RepID=UPI0035C07A1E
MAGMRVNDFLEGWQRIVKHLEKEEDAELILQQMVFGLWRIWKCRNEVVFQGVWILPHVAVELWQRHVEEFRDAMIDTMGEGGDQRDSRLSGEGKCPGVGLEEGAGQWQKPSFGELKLNSDAAWRKDSKEGEVGWVLQDFAGIPKLAGRVGEGRFGAANMAEVETIRQGLETVVGSDLMEASTRLVVESDSKGLIQILNNEITVDVTLETYPQDIWRMASLFQLVRFCFTPRQCNRAAHSVAAYVNKHGGRFGWNE